MPGKIKKMIDQIIKERSKGNPAIEQMTIAKLILKGLNPNKFDNDSPEDPEVIKKLLGFAKQLNVNSLLEDDINIKSAYSIKSMEEEAVRELKIQLKGCNPKLLVYFASPNFNQQKLASLIKIEYMDSTIIGCSTAGEIADGSIMENSIVAMAISSNIISDVKTELVDLNCEKESIDSAFYSFEKYFDESVYSMDTTKYAGIVLTDGICMKEEKVMDLIGNRTNIFFIGGSAADNLKFEKTYVSVNGQAYTNHTVLTIFKINENAEFSIIKTQSFKATEKVLVANKVKKGKREVIEFNNKPATEAYAEVIGLISSENLSQYFATNPVGLLVGKDDIFIRSPQQIKGTAIKFYCSILEGMEVRLLKPTDIIEDTKKALNDKIKEMGRIDGIINFNCIERTMELKSKNLEKQYSELFKNIPNIGFSTYGEEYIGHMNQTAAMLVFKLKLLT